MSGLGSGVAGISSGFGSHTCAVLFTGAAKCWGYKLDGELGDGTTTDRSTPVLANGFTDYTVLLPYDGEFTFTANGLSVGTHPITARYEGDSNNAASTSDALSHTVEKGKSEVNKIKIKPKKPKSGQTARVKVMIGAAAPSTGKPTGKVVVKDGRKKLGKFKVKKGKAKLKIADLAAGKHKIKAKFKGDKSWDKSAGKTSFKVK